MIRHILIALELSTFQKEFKNLWETKYHCKYRIQAYNSEMCGYFFYWIYWFNVT